MNLLTLGQTGIFQAPEPEPEQPDCEQCGGMGGFDASKDCEVYDEWIECPFCEGTGKSENGDIFVPERDAFRAGD